MYNLKKRIKENEKILDAEKYAKKIDDIARVTNWFESKEKYDKAIQIKAAQKQMNQELQLALSELKIRRNARLKDLYTAEAKMYEEELASKGFAIFKDKL